MENQSLYDVLCTLGLKLQDRGRNWRCRPPYRDSSNDTSLAISKTNGSFKDFGIGIRGSFKDLIKLITGLEKKEEVENFLEKLKYEEDYAVIRKPALTMPTAYPRSELDNLLPHYHFYLQRGISTETLKLTEGGMAGNGPMIRRFVFPIWDEKKRVIRGFAGRDLVDNGQRVKWKLLGQKRYWCYPLFLTAPYILEKREVIIVESIGDFLALWEADIRNVVVVFGVELLHYWELFNRLVSLNPSRILLAFNNDTDSKENNGQLGAAKITDSLSKVFDKRQIINAVPEQNDLGVMIPTQIQHWYDSYSA